MGRLIQCCRYAVVAASVAFWPAWVWAAERGAEGGHEGGGNPWISLGMKFFNFGILIAILYFALRKTVTQALASRQENVRKALDEARKAQAEAEAKLADYKKKVANLETEIAQIYADFKAEGENQHQRILLEADQAAAAVKRNAELAADNEVKRARDELRTEAAALAVQLAEEIIAKAYTADDQKQALKATIQNIEGLH